ncbi:MAG: response regulator transcription factor [Verrucomicrobia bacterium]|nr:response regulator transcription factor [Verrucomicrobiota bacterium]
MFLTMYRDREIFNEAIDLGVSVYVLKDNSPDEIREVLLAAADGRTWLSPMNHVPGNARAVGTVDGCAFPACIQHPWAWFGKFMGLEPHAVVASRLQRGRPKIQS